MRGSDEFGISPRPTGLTVRVEDAPVPRRPHPWWSAPRRGPRSWSSFRVLRARLQVRIALAGRRVVVAARRGVRCRGNGPRAPPRHARPAGRRGRLDRPHRLRRSVSPPGPGRSAAVPARAVREHHQPPVRAPEPPGRRASRSDPDRLLRPSPEIRSPVNHAPSDPLASLAGVQRRTMVVLVITQIVGTVGVGVAPSIGILLAEQVTNSEAWAGLARTASTLGAALFGIPLGNLAARRGPTTLTRRRLVDRRTWQRDPRGRRPAEPRRAAVCGTAARRRRRGEPAGQVRRDRPRSAAPQGPRVVHGGLWFGTLGTVIGPNLRRAGQDPRRRHRADGVRSGLPDRGGLPHPRGRRGFRRAAPRPPAHACRARVGTPTTTRKASLRQRLRDMGAELGGNRPARSCVAILTGPGGDGRHHDHDPCAHRPPWRRHRCRGHHAQHPHRGHVRVLADLVGWLSDRFGPRPAIWAGIAILLASLVIAAAWPDDTAWVMTSLFLLGLGW